MQVTILSVFSNRPDFIKPQFESMKRHIKHPFDYVVVNNAYYTETDKPKEIEETATEVGAGYIRVHHKGLKPEPSALMKDTLNFLWKVFKDTKGIVVIMDSDLFFTNDVSLIEVLGDNEMSHCPLYSFGREWLWTGLMMFNMEKVKKEEINFAFKTFDNIYLADVGSAMNTYIEKYNPKIQYLDRKSILDEDWIVKNGETLFTLGFPKPCSIDIISLFQYPFLFHYKTSSNYASHCNEEYNEQKTAALNKLLCL